MDASLNASTGHWFIGNDPMRRCINRRGGAEATHAPLLCNVMVLGISGPSLQICTLADRLYDTVIGLIGLFFLDG